MRRAEASAPCLRVLRLLSRTRSDEGRSLRLRNSAAIRAFQTARRG
jgi:hypothetical protein